MLHDIVVILDSSSVYSLSRCVHTIDQVELDSAKLRNLRVMHSFFGTPPQAWQVRGHNPRSVMNCQSLSAPKALVKMSVV